MNRLPGRCKHWIRRAFKIRKELFLTIHADSGAAFASDIPRIDRLRFERLYLPNGNKNTTTLRLLRGCAWRYQHLANQNGLVVLANPPANLIPRLLRVPRFIQLKLDVCLSNEQFLCTLPKDRKAQIRRILATGLHATYSSDPNWAEVFHDQYHLPAVRSSHGEEGYVMSANEIKNSIRNDGAEFIKIYLGRECVAAGTAQQIGDTYHLLRPGWLAGDPSWLRRGVQIARIWFAVQRARELGCQFVGMGGSPPFLDSGVLRFKLRWNPRLAMAESHWGDHFLLMDPRHPRLQLFLHAHPLLACSPSGAPVICSGKGPSELQLPTPFLQQVDQFWRLVSPEEKADQRQSDRPPITDPWSAGFVPVELKGRRTESSAWAASRS